jgi:hypothetical protein
MCWRVASIFEWKQTAKAGANASVGIAVLNMNIYMGQSNTTLTVVNSLNT